VGISLGCWISCSEQDASDTGKVVSSILGFAATQSASLETLSYQSRSESTLDGGGITVSGIGYSLDYLRATGGIEIDSAKGPLFAYLPMPYVIGVAT
jgi:hypothetical protein